MGNGGKRDGGGIALLKMVGGVFVKLIFFFYQAVDKDISRPTTIASRTERSPIFRSENEALASRQTTPSDFLLTELKALASRWKRSEILRSQEQTQRLLYDIKELLYTAFFIWQREVTW